MSIISQPSIVQHTSSPPLDFVPNQTKHAKMILYIFRKRCGAQERKRNKRKTEEEKEEEEEEEEEEEDVSEESGANKQRFRA